MGEIHTGVDCPRGVHRSGVVSETGTSETITSTKAGIKTLVRPVKTRSV